MICPNCQSNMSDKRKRCERCGTDLTLYKKVNRASNLYYNNGLARARVRDLSGAIVSLRKSLDLNKMNTNARNLLGLIYYEMGETVAALSEWVISKHFQPADNDADEYINKVQSNLTKLDALNQAIKRYNTALNLAKQGSADLAIIQLKKVVTLNTNFIRAYQLLALLLMKTGDNTRAKKYLLKVSKIDVTNTTTLRYMQELEGPAVAKDPDSNPEAEQVSSSGTIMPISSYREDKPNVMAFVNLVIGVVIGLAVMAFLVVPTLKKNSSSGSASDDTYSGYSLEQIQEMDNTITQLNQDKTELEQKVVDLQSQIDDAAVPEDSSQIYSSLFDGVKLYLAELAKPESERDFLAIADLLSGIDEAQLQIQTSVELFNQLKEATYPTVAEAQYEKGHDLYSNGKYDEALTQLQKALTFDPTDVDAVYFIGRTYQRLGDNTNAATYYNKVITEFPDSARVADAKEFLKQVQED